MLGLAEKNLLYLEYRLSDATEISSWLSRRESEKALRSTCSFLKHFSNLAILRSNTDLRFLIMLNSYKGNNVDVTSDIIVI